jgi:hypothetical protein
MERDSKKCVQLLDQMKNCQFFLPFSFLSSRLVPVRHNELCNAKSLFVSSGD